MNDGIKNIFNKLIESKLEGETLDRLVKDRLNRDLDKLTRNIFFRDIPMEEIIDVLSKEDLVLLQEDNTIWSGFFTGEEGRENISLGFEWTEDRGRYTEIENARLILSWYKRRETGNYEIVAYIS